MEIRIVLPFEPYPSPRPRFRSIGRFTQTYMPSEYIKHKEQVALHVKSRLPANFQLLETALRLIVTFYMPIPKSLSNKRKTAINGKPHIKKPDTDNLIKTYKDALESILYVNDSIICEEHIKKLYSDQPRIELIFQEVS